MEPKKKVGRPRKPEAERFVCRSVRLNLIQWEIYREIGADKELRKALDALNKNKALELGTQK